MAGAKAGLKLRAAKAALNAIGIAMLATGDVRFGTNCTGAGGLRTEGFGGARFRSQC